MKTNFQMINDNAGIFMPASISLSTVELPREIHRITEYRYESCLFYANGDSEVISTYNSLAESVEGHLKLSRKYGLTRRAK